MVLLTLDMADQACRTGRANRKTEDSLVHTITPFFSPSLSSCPHHTSCLLVKRKTDNQSIIMMADRQRLITKASVITHVQDDGRQLFRMCGKPLPISLTVVQMVG